MQKRCMPSAVHKVLLCHGHCSAQQSKTVITTLHNGHLKITSSCLFLCYKTNIGSFNMRVSCACVSVINEIFIQIVWK